MEHYRNGELEEVTKAKEVEASLKRLRRFEFALVAMTCIAATVSMLFSGYNSSRTRDFGAVIRDCTTPKGKCYEANRKNSLEFRDDVTKKLQDLQQTLLESGKCNTNQLLQHRDANELAHRLEAQHHGYTYMAPKGEAPPVAIPQDIQDACKKFLTSAQEGTK